ncbi:MAG TPA: STAS domain-containing protein [Mycobacteriales bacterium]|nr:STAS domain-containing protein [Mycobacteriales bacterium]
MPFSVRRVQGDGITTVEVDGEVDIDTAPRLRSALEAAIRSGLPIVIDLGGVTFMDSAGFGVLVSTHLQARRVGTSMLLRAVSGRIRDLLGVLGLDTVLAIEPEPAPPTSAERR